MHETELQQFGDLLKSAWPALSPLQQEKAVRFYELILGENEIQNLTRLISPVDFLNGHVLDVKELLGSGFVQFPAMDLGSGGGVPGLLAAALGFGSWVLAESEGRKAVFLKTAVEKLELTNVEVFSGRGEDFLKKREVSCVVARAIGPVERIYAWLRPCSTWNNLVLLKGPGWDAEWKTFQEGKHRAELKVAGEHKYSTGEPPKSLRAIHVVRTNVPRGTQKKV
jgi:16S rRNA (guanine527-N7)-methyltransferase